MSVRNIALLAAMSGLAGCTPLLKELRYPGGYPGFMLDKRTFDASGNKELQLLRGALILAMAARVGETSVSPEEAEGFSKQLANAAMEINYTAANLPIASKVQLVVPPSQAALDAAAALVPPGVAASTMRAVKPCVTDTVNQAADDDACDGYAVNFEADISRVESRVIRSMVAALPTDRARTFLNKVATGDMMGAAMGALGAAADAAGSFHRAAGVYRSGLEVVASGMGQQCMSPGTPFAESTMTVVQAANCLGLSQTDLLDADDAGPDRFSDAIKPGAFHAILRIVRTACVGLPLSNDTIETELTMSRDARRVACAKIRFQPQKRPDVVPLDD